MKHAIFITYFLSNIDCTETINNWLNTAALKNIIIIWLTS